MKIPYVPVVPPYLTYNYFREVGNYDAQFADLAILTYADRDFIYSKLNSPPSPFIPVEIIEQGEVQAIVASSDVLPKDGPGATVIAFRGTRTLDLKDWLIDASFKMNDKGVHEGFYNAAMPLVPRLRQLVNGKSVVFIGHSLGAALATIALWGTADQTKNASLITFGSPRVGNKAFADNVWNKTELPIGSDGTISYSTRRYVHGEDMVPMVPPEDMGFSHVGPDFAISQMPRPLANIFTLRQIFDHVPTLYAERLWLARQ